MSLRCQSIGCALSTFPEIIFVLSALVALVLLVVSILIVWKKQEFPWSVVAVLIIAFLGMAFPVIKSFEFEAGAEGMKAKFESNDQAENLSNPETQAALSNAELESKLTKLTLLVDVLNKKLDASKPGTGNAEELMKEVSAAEQTFKQSENNSQYTVMLFYRDTAEKLASDFADKLSKRGYKTARVNTDLSEVGKSLAPSSVRIRFNEGFSNQAKQIYDILVQDRSTNISLDGQAMKRQIPGDVQLLLY